MKIIDICRMNKNTNEEWIRQLNFLITNMTKLSAKTEMKIKKTEIEAADLVKLIDKMKKENDRKIDRVEVLINTVNTNINKQVKFDHIFMSTYSDNHATDHPEFDRFLEEQNKSQALLNPPKTQIPNKVKIAERDNFALLEEFRRDFGHLANAMGMSEEALLNTKGKLGVSKKLKSEMNVNFRLSRA